MAKRAGEQIDVARLQADVAAAGVELLSAHCATDRIRLQYSPQEIVTFGETPFFAARDCLRRSGVPFFLRDRGPLQSPGRREPIEEIGPSFNANQQK
jgi:hypothetical protein